MKTDEVEHLFERIARDRGLEFRKNSDGSLTILGCGMAVWVLFRVERVRGIFVTLGKEPPSDEISPYGYGLGYLIRYQTGADVLNFDAHDAAGAARLMEKYCVRYLTGEASDFADFEKFAIEKVKEMATPFPEFRATKWIRPEWT